LLLHAGGSGGPVLAHCRHDLDLSVPAVLLNHMSSHTEATHAHGGPAVYTRNLVALLILTSITVGAAFIDFGQGNVVIALTIATIKAILVALFFMHLRWEKSVNAIICLAGFLF